MGCQTCEEVRRRMKAEAQRAIKKAKQITKIKKRKTPSL